MMYLSDQYRIHCQYKTMAVDRIYGVIAMCLILKEDQFSKEEIITIVNHAFDRPRRLVRGLTRVIDCLPWAYRIVEKWNRNDHQNRVQDGSVTYDSFHLEEGKIEYNISHCMYVEIFDSFGIRELCKIFCDTDRNAYAGLTKHVNFKRYSDLSDGDCCHDVILRQ